MAEAQSPLQYYHEDREYTFLDTSKRILEELKCGICLQLLSEPVATNCEHLFCANCISSQHTCPTCCAKISRITTDRSSSRILKAFRVKCPHCSEGCEWEGELGDGGDHLRTNCLYAMTECTQGCGQVLRRIDYAEHLAVCSHKDRSVTCPHCQYACRVHNESLEDHYTKCPDFPLPCPAGCSDRNGTGSRKRKHMESHLSSECSEEYVSCKYAMLGCTQPLQRKESKDHLADKTLHLEKSMETLSAVVEVLGKLFSHPIYFRPDIPSLPLLRPWLHNSPTCYPRPPWVVKLEGFQEIVIRDQAWTSEPIYSHFGGYKMCLCVYLDGKGIGKGSHISVFACLMMGENDENLRFPFRGTITVSLLNQDIDGNHHSAALWLPSKTDSNKAGQRVMIDDLTKGWGLPQFISKNTVNPTHLCTPRLAYLEKDCMYFRVDRFEP